MPAEAAPAHPDYKRIVNARWIEKDESIEHVEVFDTDYLIPIPKPREFAPFIVAAQVLGDRLLEFQQDSRMRMFAVVKLWPALEQVILHYEREQWDLFDKAYENLSFSDTRPRTKRERVEALYNALESYGRFFRPPKSEASFRLIRQRIALAEHVSRAEAGNLVKYFRAKKKDADIDYQIQQLRGRWTKLYPVLAPIFTTDYWDSVKYQLVNYTVAQKRFDELKSFYIDSFETFCRVSVIAAGIEGIILTKRSVIPKAKGEVTLEQFDRLRNGSKPDILKNLAVTNVFVPFIDHRLRNGIGHHAKYDVIRDSIEYVIENEKGLARFRISYVLFCEKIVALYRQLELVSLYVNWVRQFTLP